MLQWPLAEGIQETRFARFLRVQTPFEGFEIPRVHQKGPSLASETGAFLATRRGLTSFLSVSAEVAFG